MAELRYEDVQRAAQAAIQNTQNMLNDVRNHVLAIQQKTELIDDHQYRLDNIDRQLNQLIQLINQFNNTFQSINSQMQNQQSVPRALNDLGYRLEALERFANDMSNYLHRRQELEDENKGFTSDF